MVSSVVPGTGTVAFKYDPFGRRIYKSSPNFTGIFAYDGFNLIMTMNSGGAVVSRYTFTQNIDEPLAEFRSGGNSYYEADGLGSITSLSSSAGALANTYTYDSFGNVTSSTGTLSNPFRYTGREFDSETGLDFNRARYYDSTAGRYLSEDLGHVNICRSFKLLQDRTILGAENECSTGSSPFSYDFGWPIVAYALVAPIATCIMPGIRHREDRVAKLLLVGWVIAIIEILFFLGTEGGEIIEVARLHPLWVCYVAMIALLILGTATKWFVNYRQDNSELINLHGDSGTPFGRLSSRHSGSRMTWIGMLITGSLLAVIWLYGIASR
jgi:RHS repeat-associated protein